ncbi:hypothetical protein JOE44_001931 [Chryseobacterium sp. PvR013]|uniref:hypothetical protein n=1 Tax=Chryseobacterium sp. PvR013 TaxID=2806595 RepID=UPI001AEB00A5|nr:hypothetical protein [Chryseobacterium sp. PvR013]MBP1165047.1 hypothetical protein [Chryseobacterium sp. PvR013]
MEMDDGASERFDGLNQDQRDKMAAIGKKAMDDYREALQAYKAIGYLWIIINRHILDKTIILYYVINLN